jgi:hypothetical protein
LASLAPGLALVPAFGGDLDLVADLRGFVILPPELNILRHLSPQALPSGFVLHTSGPGYSSGGKFRELCVKGSRKRRRVRLRNGFRYCSAAPQPQDTSGCTQWGGIVRYLRCGRCVEAPEDAARCDRLRGAEADPIAWLDFEMAHYSVHGSFGDSGWWSLCQR